MKKYPLANMFYTAAIYYKWTIKHIFHFLILLMIALPLAIFGQAGPQNIIPLSPTAAALTAYTDVPVDYFTGVPGIAIPVYTISDADLNLSLNLSYHAGGNKVESQSTWIGLGWSLNDLPIISRSVNGYPDEKPGGFFTPYSNLECSQIFDKRLSGISGNNADMAAYRDYANSISQKMVDPEPDVFSFSINGHSGKFYYNQKLKKFVCTPFNNLKITFSNDNFKIISDDGTIYNFFSIDRELSKSEGQNASEYIPTSWMISSIENPEQTRKISFEYTTETITTMGLIENYKYVFVGGAACQPIPPYTGASGVINTLQTKRLKNIRFRNGLVRFVPKTVVRADLNNSYALDSIVVEDNTQNSIKRYSFFQSFMGSGGTDTYKSNKWMLLDSVFETSTSGRLAPYRFKYKRTIFPSSRTSFAQDHWGYYNGKVSNNTLIPTSVVTVPVSGEKIVVSGADRSVDTVYNQFGILEEIQYPTGGKRKFLYETNKIDNATSGVPLQFKTEYATIQVNDGSSSEPPNYPPQATYETTFTINNPSNSDLNGNNPAGGAYTKFEIGGLEDGDLGTSSTLIIIRGTSSGNSNIVLNAVDNFDNHYFPNGNYKITASFDQTPPRYQDFFCILSWKKIDSTATNSGDNSYAGGLRVKEIQMYSSENIAPEVLDFRYTTAIDTNRSSGDIFSQKSPNYFDYISNVSLASYYCNATYARLRSYSTQPQVTHSGSYVGYKKVYVFNSSPLTNGFTSYEYTHSKDIDQAAAPYPPAISYEAFRGQLKEKRDYVFRNNNFQILKSTTYNYKDVTIDTAVIYGIKPDLDCVDPAISIITTPPLVTVTYPIAILYEIDLNWSALSAVKERIYNATDSTKYIETITEYNYDEPQNRIKEKITSTSNQRTRTSRYFYPTDLQLTGELETARTLMINRNMINLVLKTDLLEQSKLLKSLYNQYKIFGLPRYLRPYHTFSKIKDSIETESIYMNKYDTAGNILERQKVNGFKEVYLWGYNDQYPVAKIVGSDSATVSAVVTQAQINAAVSNDQTLRTLLNTLRTDSRTKNAEVTTYTYKPLLGITSETDPTGKITFYEYDSFGRLSFIKDEKGNILKKLCYNYAGQVVNCNQ